MPVAGRFNARKGKKSNHVAERRMEDNPNQSQQMPLSLIGSNFFIDLINFLQMPWGIVASVVKRIMSI